MKKLTGKLTALLLCICLMFGEFAIPAQAAGNAGKDKLQDVQWFNTCIASSYEDAVAKSVDVNSDRTADEILEADRKRAEIPYFSDIRLAGDYLRKCMKERRTEATFKMTTPSVAAASAYIDDIADVAWEETTDPFEGDYLHFNMTGWKIDVNRSIRERASGATTYVYKLYYLTTENQERSVKAKVEKLKKTTFKGYEKHKDAYNVKMAYDWVCKNFTYDHSYNEDHTAYGGVIKGKTVCQGYATAMYMLCRSLGVNARVVTSYNKSQGQGHAWNIVEINGKYYNVDATWGDQFVESGDTNIATLFFLTTDYAIMAMDDSQDHVRESWCSTSEFYQKHPMASTSYNYVASREKTLKAVKSVGVTYATQVQSVGWQNWKKDGTTAGTMGKGLRMESLMIKLTNKSGLDLGVQYKTHVQRIGWESSWKNNGAVSGTVGQGLRVEAIRIRLTGADAAKYDIYYRVHAQRYGWLDWAKNGEIAGTSGQGLRLEGIQIVVCKRTTTFNKRTFKGATTAVAGCSYVEYGKAAEENSEITGLVNYRTQVQTYGWQGYVSDGAISGTMNEAKRLETIQINLGDTGYKGNILYNTHIQRIGWQGWKSNNAISGTVGMGLRLEAIQIKLTGEVGRHYDVYYRVHAQSFGWLGWAKNGKSAGTAGLGKRLESIQIILLPKGSKAPAGNGMPAYVH